jgi:hypothetical protein
VVCYAGYTITLQTPFRNANVSANPEQSKARRQH